MDDMKRAIAEGVLSNNEKTNLAQKTEEIREYINGKEKLTTEEEQLLHNIETTYKLIMRIEKEYLNQHINYLRER
jgi:hypothetical protein